MYWHRIILDLDEVINVFRLVGMDGFDTIVKGHLLAYDSACGERGRGESTDEQRPHALCRPVLR